MVQIRVEPITPDSIPAHMALARTTYEDPILSDPAHFWWKHGSSPYGPSTSVGLYDEGEALVGRALVQPRAFYLGPSDSRRAGLVVDLLLVPSYRSAMNFIALVRNQPKQPDMGILIHTSNETSDPLYRKLLRYPVAFELKAYMLPLRILRIAGKLTGRVLPALFELLTAPWRGALSFGAALARRSIGIRVDEGLPPDREFAELMQRFRATAGPHFERSRAFLEWRFKGPIFRGDLATVRWKSQTIGYVGWRNVTLEGLNFFVVMDIVVVQKLSWLQRFALWLELARRASASGADALFIMLNRANPALAELIGWMLIPIPDSRLPHPTPIFVLPQDADLKSLPYISTYMTLADIDYF
jgi:hypothetical protein